MPGKPVLLDRDGTLIVEQRYLRDPDGVMLEAGVVAGLRRLQRLGHPLIVVSNQSGIGRHLLTADDARRINERTAELLRHEGVAIAGWYFCPHTPEDGCDCRKPLPGMALQAARELGVTLAGGYVIGDKQSDVELADAIGATGILVTTGHGSGSVAWASANSRPVFERLDQAAEYIAK